jgi:acid-sensing ion channel, other
MVHHTNDFAVESAPTTYLPLAKETFIDIQPIHSSCSEQVLGLPFAQRKCIIPSDLNVESYRQPACMLDCLRNIIHKRCFCHPFHLPKDLNETEIFRDCKAKDVMCFVQNYCKFALFCCII